MVVREALYLGLSDTVRENPQIAHCAERARATLGVADEGDWLDANALLGLTRDLTVKEKFDGALATWVKVITHDCYVVPSPLLLLEIDASVDNLAGVVTDGLQPRGRLIDLHVATDAMDALNEDMSSPGIVQSDWQDHPEADGPPLHDALNYLKSTRHLDYVSEVEECSPISVQAPVVGQPVRLSPLDQIVVGASRVER